MKFGFLNNNERQAILKIQDELSRNCAGLIRYLYLYGSKARGDFTQESDIDLLVVTKQLDTALRRKIVFLISDAGFEQGVYVSPKVMDLSHYEQLEKSRNSFIANIQKEGVSLWKNH